MPLYLAYEARRHSLAPLRAMARLEAEMLRSLPTHMVNNPFVRTRLATSELIALTSPTHVRPSYDIDSVRVDGQSVAVEQESVASTPFGTLVRLTKEIAEPGPPVLLVAPLSGHFATMLRGTARTLLQDHDVYVTDWHNGRDVPRRHGRFGLDEYITHLIDFLAEIGPGAHLVAVCQPCPAALAATALMAEDSHPAQPRSLTLMAGPVDTRINPSKVNELANERPLEWFERRMITRVPPGYPGRGRRVYPGFLQLTAFMSMNARRHATAFRGLFQNVAQGNHDEAARARAFYDEYFAVLDIPAEFYLETVRVIFQDHDLPRGELRVGGRRVDPRAIGSALLTVEAELDDMCSPGQTQAAHELCSGIPAERHHHHLQPGVGHYGVFAGSRWEREIYPHVRDFIARNA